MRVHFVSDAATASFFDKYDTSAIDRFPDRFKDSNWAWIAQTALILRDVGVQVSVGCEFKNDRINVALADRIRSMRRAPDVFVVSIDADQLRPKWVNFFIAQNKLQVAGPRAIWMPHWPQPGLIPRSLDRSGFSQVGYFGTLYNLYRDADWWRKICAETGMKFIIRNPNDWNDYSDIDVVVAVRSFPSNKKYENKPPSKLFNAWLASSVFIGGGDSAYRQVGAPGQDYLLAKNEGDLKRHLVRLREDPKYGDALTERGGERVEDVGSRESTSRRWQKVLETEIRGVYEDWYSQPKIVRRRQYLGGLWGDYMIRKRNATWRRVRPFVRFRDS